ncbi:MAG: 1-phosphofructokinase, partial [uncultured Thermoleophilia bacterium]
QTRRRAGRRDRPCGRGDGPAHRRGADPRGDPQRLRADRGRVADVDRGHRPDRRPADRDQRVRAGGHGGGARDPEREAPLPVDRRRRGRPGRVAAPPRGAGLVRGRDPRAPAAEGHGRARLGGRAAPARRRRGAGLRRAEPVRGRGARRARVRDGRRLRRGAGRDRGARRPQRADHPRERLLRVAAGRRPGAAVLGRGRRARGGRDGRLGRRVPGGLPGRARPREACRGVPAAGRGVRDGQHAHRRRRSPRPARRHALRRAHPGDRARRESRRL